MPITDTHESPRRILYKKLINIVIMNNGIKSKTYSYMRRTVLHTCIPEIFHYPFFICLHSYNISKKYYFVNVLVFYIHVVHIFPTMWILRKLYGVLKQNIWFVQR